MLTSYSGRTALVTGAGSGIGKAACAALSDMGMNLVLCGRKKEKLLNAAEESKCSEGHFLLEAGDLTEPVQIKKAADDARRTFGSIDVLINNAGMALNKSLEETTLSEFRELMQINAEVPFLFCQELLPDLRKSEVPAIINIASVTAYHGYKDQSAYSASKHALLGLSESLAKEVQKDNIRVHVICPGGVYTDMIRTARPDLSPEGLILPEDIAEYIRFLLEHRSNAVVDRIDIHRTGKEPFL